MKQQENVKRIFEEVADLARQQQCDYKFDTAELNGVVRKYFYFGDKLVGLGEDPSAR